MKPGMTVGQLRKQLNWLTQKGDLKNSDRVFVGGVGDAKPGYVQSIVMPKVVPDWDAAARPLILMFEAENDP